MVAVDRRGLAEHPLAIGDRSSAPRSGRGSTDDTSCDRPQRPRAGSNASLPTGGLERVVGAESALQKGRGIHASRGVVCQPTSKRCALTGSHQRAEKRRRCVVRLSAADDYGPPEPSPATARRLAPSPSRGFPSRAPPRTNGVKSSRVLSGSLPFFGRARSTSRRWSHAHDDGAFRRRTAPRSREDREHLSATARSRARRLFELSPVIPDRARQHAGESRDRSAGHISNNIRSLRISVPCHGGRARALLDVLPV